MIRQTLIILLTAFIAISCKHKKISEQDDLESDFVVLHGTNTIQGNYAKEQFEDGLAFLEKHKYNEAKYCFFRADSANPNNSIILTAIGGAVGITENQDSSFKYFKKALKMDSNNSKAYISYGYWLNRATRFEDGKEILYLGLQRSKASRFDSAIFYLDLSFSFLRLKEDSVALSLMDSAKIRLAKGELFNRIAQAQLEIENEEINQR